jgi:hypothetical protein
VDERFATVEAESGRRRSGTRVGVVAVACMAVLAAVQLMTAGLPGSGSASAPFGVVGDAMSTACETLPRVGVSTAGGNVLVDFTNPADGVRIDEASALLAEHGVDVQFAVQPLDGQPVKRIIADGGAGDTTPVVDGGVVARAGGAPSDLSLPTSMRRSVWFTLACTPR